MNLPEITGAMPTCPALAGYEMSEAGLGEIAEAQTHFTALFLASVAKIPDPEGIAMRSTASAQVMGGVFNWPYGPAFLSAMDTRTNVPFLLWLILKIKQPKISFTEATALIKPGSLEEIRAVVLECFGYKLDTKPPKDSSPNVTAPVESSTGAKSTSSSEIADSSQMTSAG